MPISNFSKSSEQLLDKKKRKKFPIKFKSMQDIVIEVIFRAQIIDEVDVQKSMYK